MKTKDLSKRKFSSGTKRSALDVKVNQVNWIYSQQNANINNFSNILNLNQELQELWLELVIWIETHITVTNTKTKLFCSCLNDTESAPNTNICPTCTGKDTSSPQVNLDVVKSATFLSNALWWELANTLSFDRKHYSYPDLPKWYQITQYRDPISKWWSVPFMRPDGTEWKVDIDHFHIEEDPAKLTYLKNWKIDLDFNRSGKPLFEVVTTPSIHSIEDAILYMEQLQKIVRYTWVSDADMEKWHFKSDVSLSLRKAGTNDLNPRTEIKNLNSFKFALQALHLEVEEQLNIRKNTKAPQKQQQTKWWREDKLALEVMREKETEADYNYIPEPNIPERDITEIVSEKIDFEFLPYQVEKQLMDSGLSYQDAIFFSADLDKIIALYTLSDEKGLYDTAKLLINLPQSVRYDNTVSLSIIKKLFALFSQSKYFDQTLLKIVLDYLSKDPDFDFEQFIDEKTHLTDDLKEAIRKVVAKNPNKSVGSIIGQMIQKNILPQYFSRSLVLEFIGSLWKTNDQIKTLEKVKGSKNTAEKTYEYDFDTFLKPYRTHSISEISNSLENQKVTTSWWIQSIRDHGDLVFIDLRCKGEILQIQIDKKSDINLDEITRWADESVIKVEWTLIKRSPDDINERLRLGIIELKADKIELLSGSQNTPFEVPQSHKVNENLRMTYRYLDLRNPHIMENVIKRHEVTQYIRSFFDQRWFLHVDTPILGKPSDEWSREFSVPSRLHPSSFYTLPQAPQQLKQLLMWSGVDKYYQIARCFRDEDPKWDRQPEFTQVDMEMAYIQEEDIVALISELVVWILEKNYPHKKLITKTIPHYDYNYIMEHYSTDKPDLRYWLKMYTLTDMLKDCGFDVFANIVAKWWIVKAMLVEWWKKMFSKKYLDVTLKEFTQQLGWWGLANFHVWWEANFVEEKLGKELVAKIIEKTGAKEWDTLLFVADQESTAHQILSQTRQKIAKDYKLYKEDDISLLRVRNFPMFEKTDEGKRKFTHNPFSMPKIECLKDFMEGKNIPNIMAQQYDIVMNWNEVWGWSIRAHLPELLQQTYKIMGYTPEETQKSVGHMLEAFKFWFPPHGWLALGLDRILMILQWHDTIREVIPFPKTGDGKDLLMGAPAPRSS